MHALFDDKYELEKKHKIIKFIENNNNLHCHKVF